MCSRLVSYIVLLDYVLIIALRTRFMASATANCTCQSIVKYVLVLVLEFFYSILSYSVGSNVIYLVFYSGACKGAPRGAVRVPD